MFHPQFNFAPLRNVGWIPVDPIYSPMYWQKMADVFVPRLLSLTFCLRSGFLFFYICALTRFQMRYRVDPYQIIGILLETLGYGIFLVLFALSTFLLLRRRGDLLKEKVIEPRGLRSLTFYLIMSALMFCTITVVCDPLLCLAPYRSQTLVAMR